MSEKQIMQNFYGAEAQTPGVRLLTGDEIHAVSGGQTPADDFWDGVGYAVTGLLLGAIAGLIEWIFS